MLVLPPQRAYDCQLLGGQRSVVTGVHYVPSGILLRPAVVLLLRALLHQWYQGLLPQVHVLQTSRRGQIHVGLN